MSPRVANSQFEDVISVETNFHSLPSDLSSGTAANATNEIKLEYKAP